MMFSTNQIVESVLCEAPFEQPARVLWMNRDLDMATLFTVSEPLKKPWRARISEIESMLKAGKLRVMSMRPAVFMLQSEDELSEAAKAKRSECWALISPIYEGKYGDRIYYPGEMGSIIVAHAEEVQKPLKTIYRLLYRYWALGMTPNAFIGQYVNSGGRGKARNFSPTSMPVPRRIRKAPRLRPYRQRRGRGQCQQPGIHPLHEHLQAEGRAAL